MWKKKFQGEELSHELLLTTRQKAKIRNAFASNMSTDEKLVKLRYLKQFNLVDLLVFG